MALRDQPYLPLYVQDFLTDEKLIECSASATGIYIRIMCIMHKSDEYGTIMLKQKDKQTSNQIENFALKFAKFMPYDVKEIIIGLTELLNEGVLQNGGDKLMQKRMVKDNEISIIRAEAGKKGGLKTQYAKAKAEANAENENENINIIEDKSINVPFENFWNLYDKKEDKINCERKWSALTNKERTECIAKLPAYVNSTPDKQFRKNPATYLNNKSWENEIITLGASKPTLLTYDEMLELTKNNPDIWKQYDAIKRDGERKAVFQLKK